ncbi:MAG TPA: stage II sporulation protein M [Methanosarcinales archaeon]|nr:stage II sporulation protein M [Methanosarcinales archaeon]
MTKKEALIYLHSIKYHILFISLWFIAFTIIGYWYSSENPSSAIKSLESMKGLFEWIKSLNPLFIMLLIFFNNAFKSFLALVLGIGFGIAPIAFVVLNGSVLGIMIQITKQTKGVLFVITALAPHGIIEIPMILLSASIGVKLGSEFINAIQGKNSNIKQEFKKGISFYIHWILPLLFIAAIIETFITSTLIYYLF